MTELMNIRVSTSDLQKRIDKGEQFENTGYSNRIKLRSTSRANISENIMNYAVVANEYTTDNGYTITDYNAEQSQLISPSKPINLKEERFNGMLANVSKILPLSTEIDTKNEKEIASKEKEPAPVSVEDSVAVTTDDQVSRADNKEVSNFEEHIEKKKDEIVADKELPKQVNEMDINNSDVNKFYEEILKETNETKQAKEQAEKANEEVKKQEELTKKQIEESDKKLLEKSAEQAEIQAKKEAANARKAEVDKQIVATLNNQRSIMKEAKKSYLAQQQTSKARVDELRQKAALKTQENNDKIVEFQKNIDADKLEINVMEEEIAKKEAILAALSTSPEFFASMTNNTITNNDNENEISHAKVA